MEISKKKKTFPASVSERLAFMAKAMLTVLCLDWMSETLQMQSTCQRESKMLLMLRRGPALLSPPFVVNHSKYIFYVSF